MHSRCCSPSERPRALSSSLSLTSSHRAARAQRPLDVLRQLGPSSAIAQHARPEGDVVEHALRKGVRLLEHHPHPAAELVDVDIGAARCPRSSSRIRPSTRVPGIVIVHAVQAAQEGGLAAAGRADQGRDLARRHRQARPRPRRASHRRKRSGPRRGFSPGPSRPHFGFYLAASARFVVRGRSSFRPARRCTGRMTPGRIIPTDALRRTPAADQHRPVRSPFRRRLHLQDHPPARRRPGRPSSTKAPTRWSIWLWRGPRPTWRSRPAVEISVTGGGSGTGLAALINATVDMANASRADQARGDRRSPRPTAWNRWSPSWPATPSPSSSTRANPVDHLTIDQISAIYSGAISNWKRSRRGGPADRPPVPRDQFRHARLLPGGGAAAGPAGRPDSVRRRHAAAALVGRDRRRGRLQPRTPSATTAWGMSPTR